MIRFSTKPDACEKCGVLEKTLHPLHTFVVALSEVEISEHEKSYLCQRCKISYLMESKNVFSTRKKKKKKQPVNVFRSFFGI